MSNLNTTPVIVVTEEKKRRRGLVWVAAGAAVAVAAVGGGTFALWTDTETFNGGTITAGDLDLTMIQGTKYYDISPDRTDVADIKTADNVTLQDTMKHLDVTEVVKTTPTVLKGHEIDLTSWRIVPGDTVALVAETQITLIGDNLVAELMVDPGTLAIGSAAEGPGPGDEPDEDGFGNGLSYTYTLYNSDGVVIPGFDHVDMGGNSTFSGHLAYISASETGQASGADDAEDLPSPNSVISIDDIDGSTAAGATPTGTARVTVVIEATFPGVGGQDDVGAAEAIGSIRMSLNQLRAGSKAIDLSTNIGANNKF